MADLEEPHENDVLCGRGVTINKWPGNESFRRLVGLNKEVYVSSTKRQKMAISRSIVEAVRALDPPGRFLEKDRATGLWTEIGHKKAIEKTSQALRDGAASLRKQLSADFGDPNFLNAVFDDNGDKSESVTSCGDSDDSVTCGGASAGGAEVEHPTQAAEQAAFPVVEEVKSCTKTKEMSEDCMKVDSVLVEKKVVVTKKVSSKSSQNSTAKTLPAKRGLRRSRSNPCLAPSSTKSYRKFKQKDKYSFVATSPRTPMSRHSASQPGSPIPRGGHLPYHENVDSGSFGPVPAYSSYYTGSPASYDYCSYENGYDQHGYDPRYFGRSHSYDHYAGYGPETRPDYRHAHSWSHDPSSPYQPSSVRSVPGGSSYPWGYYSASRSSGRQTPPRHPSSGSPAPTSPLPRGVLPPGRHQFSPAGYRSDPPEHEPSRRHEEYQGYSPRYPYESRSPAHTERSPLWKSPYTGDYYSSPAPPGYSTSFSESVNTSHSGSLSVPSLGGENRYYGTARMQIQSPWSRSSGGETPPRPPVSSRDFAPPEPQSRVRLIRRREKYTHPWEQIEGFRSRKATSTTGEEKKVDNDATSGFNRKSPPTNNTSTSPVPSEDTKKAVSLQAERVSSNDADVDSLAENEDGMVVDGCGPFGRSTEKIDSVRSSPALSIRSSPLLARISIVAADTDYAEQVEDIEMSPISQADHEDPTTLMELPENLMTLPISPCGPHDYPVAPPRA